MKKIIFIGLLSFFIAAIWQLPLSFAKPYIEKSVNGLKLEGPMGTVWDGKTDVLRVAKTNIDQVSWKVKPLKSLISLSLKTDFTINDPNITAHGLAGITPSQNIILDDTQFELNATYLNKLQQHAKIAGDIKGNIKHAKIYKDPNELPKVEGIIDWKDASLTSPMKLSSGDYKAIITPVSGDLSIKISSFEAPAELKAEIKINKAWEYDADINIKSKDQSIQSVLTLLGKKQSDGSIAVKRSGNLKITKPIKSKQRQQANKQDF